MSKSEKLKELARSVLDRPKQEVKAVLSSLHFSKKDALEGYLNYNLDVMAYSNEIYCLLGTRIAMYLQNLIPGSWHQERHKIVLSMLKNINPTSIVDMGFGVPGEHIKEFILKKKINTVLVDNCDSAFEFGKELLDLWDTNWRETISFKQLDMNTFEYPGNFDCYIFLDSIEHIKDATNYLKKIVSKSNPESNFILSIPVGPMIPSHTLGWNTEEEVIQWLQENGLHINGKKRVYPNPKVDLFAAETNGKIFDIIISCSKKHKTKSLPLLDYAKNMCSPIENSLLLVCHHILESNLILLDYLIQSGIQPENVHVIGKSYSTSESTIQDYKKMGINVHKNSLTFDSHIPFDIQLKDHIKSFLNDISKKDLSKYDNILILDDGGELLLQSNELFKDDKRVVGVEQTASGYQKLSKTSLNIPVINVATSQSKLEYESPIIAETILRELNKRILQMDMEPKTILIMGNGPIGSNIAKVLKDNYKVFVYDKSSERSNISKDDLKRVMPECDMIIGCTGEASIVESHYPMLKKNVILVSASSSDREFESYKIRKNHPKTVNTHKDFHVNDVILLNGGFPLNFDGNKVCVPLEEIQLTEALMYIAAVKPLRQNIKNQSYL